jgi:hypothetical protein
VNVTVVMLVFAVNVLDDDGTRGRDACPLSSFEGEGVPVEGESAQDLTHLQLIGTGVDERRKNHVTGDSGRAVEPDRATHVELRVARTIRAAAHAAP